jgi:amino acid transporter
LKSERKVFLRDATGLVRDFTATDALILAVANIIGPVWIVIFTSEWLAFPGTNIPLSFIFAGILVVVQSVFYILMTNAMPRSGGGTYVPLSRTIHPLLGMAMSFLLVVAFMFTFGLVDDVLVTVAIASPLSALGSITSNTALLNIGSALATSTWTFVVGTIVIVLVGIVAVAGPHIIAIVNKIAFIIGTGSILVIAGVLLTSSQTHFQNALNSVAGSGVYQNITATAHANGWSTPSSFLLPTVLSLPLSYYALIGFQSNTYYSGEIRRISKTITFAVIVSIIYTAIFYSVISYLMERTFGTDFITSANYLFSAVPSKYPLSFAPWVNNFIAVLNSNPIVNGFIIAGFIAFGYLILMVFFVIVSRHFLAWSFDRTVPAFLGKINDRLHSPVTAIIITGVVAWVALIFYAFESAVVSTVNNSFLLIMALMLDGLAGIAIVRRKDLLASAPAFVRKSVGGIPIIAIFGAYSVCFIVFLVIESLYNPAIAGTFGLATVGVIVTSLVLGIVSYLGMKTYLRGKGIDITLAFKEIPPE